jgi:hypothetical protein
LIPSWQRACSIPRAVQTSAWKFPVIVGAAVRRKDGKNEYLYLFCFFVDFLWLPDDCGQQEIKL